MSEDDVYKQRHVIDFIWIALSLFFVFLWWSLYSKSPMGFRGADFAFDKIAVASCQDIQCRMATFCNDLPACLRPFTSWSVLLIETILVKPLLIFFSPANIDIEMARSISSVFVTVSAYFFSFLMLRGILPGFWGFLPLLTFGLIPASSLRVGLVHYDTFALLYWPVFFRVIRLILADQLGKNYRTLALVLLILVACSIKENMGFAASGAFFVMFLFRKSLGSQLNLLRWSIFSAFGSAAVLGLFILIAYRNGDAFWIVPGGNFKTQISYYVLGNNAADVFVFIWKLVRLSLLTSLGYFTIIWILSSRKVPENKSMDLKLISKSIIIWGGISLGLIATIVPGYFTAGFSSEWPRQFLPIAYALTCFTYHLAALAGEKIKSPKNKVF